jgi:hypothetical protein
MSIAEKGPIVACVLDGIYGMIGSATIRGSLSYLLCVTDDQLIITICQSCGLYSVRRDCFSDTTFHGFIEGLNIPIGITRYKNPKMKTGSLLVSKMGQGSYPAEPLQQVRNQLRPPNHQSRKEERQLIASLLKLCCKEVDTTGLRPSGDTSSTPSINARLKSCYCLLRLILCY